MNHTRDYYRKERARAIHRKEKIIREYRADSLPAYEVDNTEPSLRNSTGMISPIWATKHRGELAKGKIHCSCTLCSYQDVPRADKRMIDKMMAQVSELFDENLGVDVSIINGLNEKLKKAKVFPDHETWRVCTNEKQSKKIDHEAFETLIREKKGENSSGEKTA